MMRLVGRHRKAGFAFLGETCPRHEGREFGLVGEAFVLVGLHAGAAEDGRHDGKRMANNGTG